MTDWADGIETRNYGIKNEMDVRMLSELMRAVVALAMVAGTLLFYSWIRNQIINTGYESQNLFALEESLLRTQRSLILEEEMLRDPKRIDFIARNTLGMVPMRPGQLIPPQFQDVGAGAGDMAMTKTKDEVARESGAAKFVAELTN